MDDQADTPKSPNPTSKTTTSDTRSSGATTKPSGATTKPSGDAAEPSGPSTNPRPATTTRSTTSRTGSDVRTDDRTEDRDARTVPQRAPSPATGSGDAPKVAKVATVATAAAPVAPSAAARGAGSPPVGLLNSMWRYRGMCTAIVVVCVVLSVGIGYLVSPGPKATATIALKTPGADNVLAPVSSSDAALARYTAQRARFATSDAVLGNVAAALGTKDLAALRDRLTIAPSTDSNAITVAASGANAAEAVNLANEVARAYGEETEKQVSDLTDAALSSIDKNVTELRSEITANGSSAVNGAAAATLAQVQQRAASIRTSSAVLGDGVDFVVKPDMSSVKDNKLPLKEAALGLIIGLVIAGTVAYLRADNEAASEQDA